MERAMQEKLITAQDAAGIVTLEALKMHCRIDDDITESDDLLRVLLRAAVEQCQHRLGRPILPQVWERIFEPTTPVLQLHPDVLLVQSITAVRDEDEIALALDDWQLKDARRLVAKSGWPSGTRALRVRYRCGAWATALEVPDAIRQWLMVRVSTAYANSESIVTGTIVNEMPRDYVDGLLDPWRAF